MIIPISIDVMPLRHETYATPPYAAAVTIDKVAVDGYRLHYANLILHITAEEGEASCYGL